MNKVEINVCGKSINIVPTAIVVKVEKMNDKYVYFVIWYLLINIVLI